MLENDARLIPQFAPPHVTLTLACELMDCTSNLFVFTCRSNMVMIMEGQRVFDPGFTINLFNSVNVSESKGLVPMHFRLEF